MATDLIERLNTDTRRLKQTCLGAFAGGMFTTLSILIWIGFGGGPSSDLWAVLVPGAVGFAGPLWLRVGMDRLEQRATRLGVSWGRKPGFGQP